jgi:hypothetical protein
MTPPTKYVTVLYHYDPDFYIDGVNVIAAFGPDDDHALVEVQAHFESLGIDWYQFDQVTIPLNPDGPLALENYDPDFEPQGGPDA